MDVITTEDGTEFFYDNAVINGGIDLKYKNSTQKRKYQKKALLLHVKLQIVYL